MSLKEFTKEIFTRYGLTEVDINIYIRYLRVPRATFSEVLLSLEEEHPDLTLEKVEEITKMLEEKGFVKIVEGIVPRVIPLEPFFELFTAESEAFRDEIAKIKDNILADQSKRFENLEAIQDKSINEVNTAVDAQIKAFNEDSDAKNAAKKDRIDKATNRFTETSKTLESDLHNTSEEDYSRLTDDVNRIDKESDDVWDANTSKFTEDNNTLNNELSQITQDQVNSSKSIESNIHSIVDTLNTDLQSISQSFVSDNENAINNSKVNINKIIAELLGDFSDRIGELEKELKQDLDDHVERHKNIANELKPKMEQILEKYLERMNKVTTDLKDKISKLLAEHSNHIKTTTDSVRSNIHAKVEERHKLLSDQTLSYKDKALLMLRNLIDSANRFSDFSDDLAHQGLFFTGKKKKKYKARWAQVEEDVASIARPYEDDFINECETFVNTTRQTTDSIKGEVTDIIARENISLDAETTDLDQKAQETINAQLETLATDMASELDNTLQSGVKDCSDTTIKLKDSLEKSFSQHQKQYDDALNRHKEETLRHYNDFDADIKRKNENWVKDVDIKSDGGKNDTSRDIENQIRTINEHLDKTKIKNVDHSNTFQKDVNDVKTKQRTIYDDLLAKVRADFDKSKSNTSGKIDAEINLWNEESADMNTNLSNMLEDHKAKYNENATTLQNSLNTTTKDNIQNIKDAIADFTLEFMNSIDDSTELAESSEDKLHDIQNAAKSIPELSRVTTWHTVGRAALINNMRDAILRVKSSIIIVTPVVVPEILQMCSQHAYKKKAARFMLTSDWNMQQYGNIIQKMKALGNIQFRQLNQKGDYYAVTRDAEEVIIAPFTDDETQMISFVSNQELYAKLFSQVIGPIFQANSRPVK